MTFKVARCARILPLARWMLTAIACFAVALPAFAADQEYRLSPGDTIEISAAGVPELKDKAQINVDGNVSLPLIGQLHVAGMPISEVRDKIGQILPTKEFRLHTGDGREYPVIISPDQISVRIVEYRPVYLTGDVAKPGQEAYRPGLTVRQAVALAGGYDIMRFRMENPFLQLPELRGEYNSLWMEFAKQQANIARIKAALAGKANIDFSAAAKTPVPKQLSSTINRLATDELAARTANLQNEKTFLQQAKAKEEGRVGTLTKLKQKEDEGTSAETADLKRLQGLFAKGAVPITRVEEARRAILLSSTRYLETIAQIAQVERERDKVGRQYARLDEERRVQLLRNLQDANVKLAQTRARLQAVSEKLVYTGMVRSQLVNGDGAKPILTIYRQGPNGTTRTNADEDSRLLPGDTVEVVLRQPGQGTDVSAD